MFCKSMVNMDNKVIQFLGNILCQLDPFIKYSNGIFILLVVLDKNIESQKLGQMNILSTSSRFRILSYNTRLLPPVFIAPVLYQVIISPQEYILETSYCLIFFSISYLCFNTITIGWAPLTKGPSSHLKMFAIPTFFFIPMFLNSL